MRRVFSNRKVQLLLNGVFGVLLLVVAVVGGRKFAHSGFALRHADPMLLAGATILFLIAFAFKAWGWQRLFSSGERPSVVTLAAAGGAASVGGIALPGRCDDVIRVAIVRRCRRRRRASIGAVALSLFLLGLLDSAALAPLAYAAALVSHVGGWLKVGLFVVAA